MLGAARSRRRRRPVCRAVSAGTARISSIRCSAPSPVCSWVYACSAWPERQRQEEQVQDERHQVADGDRAGGHPGPADAEHQQEGALDGDRADRADQSPAAGPPARPAWYASRRAAGDGRRLPGLGPLARMVRAAEMARSTAEVISPIRSWACSEPAPRTRRAKVTAKRQPQCRPRAAVTPNSSGSSSTIATPAPTTITAPVTVSKSPEVTTARSRVVSAPTRDSRSPVRRRSYSAIGSRSRCRGEPPPGGQHHALRRCVAAGSRAARRWPRPAPRSADQHRHQARRRGWRSPMRSSTVRVSSGCASDAPRRPATARPPRPGCRGAPAGTAAAPPDRPVGPQRRHRPTGPSRCRRRPVRRGAHAGNGSPPRHPAGRAPARRVSPARRVRWTAPPEAPGGDARPDR